MSCIVFWIFIALLILHSRLYYAICLASITMFFLLDCSHEELIARQRQMLRRRLGLGMLSGVDLGIDELVDERDLIATQSARPKLGVIGKQSSTEV